MMKQNDINIKVSSEDTNLILQLSILNHLIGFPEENFRIFDVSLSRLDKNGTKAFECLLQVALRLIDFLENNPKSILYFYCDDVHDVDRRNKNVSMQEYRHRLFSQIFNYLKRRVSKNIFDEFIICEVEGSKMFIHLIYFEDMKYASDEIKRMIKDQTSK